MATTTPNFGWSVPTSSDLVKNGAVAIETLGDAIDASLVNLKGGTTGQVLSKASGTDMDFAWVSDAAGMTNPMTTTGDTIYSSSGSTPARLGIGTAGQVLQVNSGATAPEWATPAGGGSLTLLSTTTLSGTTTTISGISGSYQDLLILVYGKTNSGSTGSFYIAPNGSTSNTTQFQINTNTTVISYTADPLYLRNDTYGYDVSSANNSLQLLIRNYANTVAWKPFSGSGGYTSDRPGTDPWMTQGAIKTTSAITSLNFTQTGGGSFTAGTVKIYGVN
jgi:hypothetical protein